MRTATILLAGSVLVLGLNGCTQLDQIRGKTAASQPVNPEGEQAEVNYIIGPGDSLEVFVWGNPDLSATVPVRPDGRITTPLVEDVQASGKSPSELARAMEERLARYVKHPVVTVTVSEVVGRATEQIRVVGQAVEPRMIPYSEDLTVLDVLIAVGGLTEFAAGNRASIVRKVGKTDKQQFNVRLADLVKDGDISANVEMRPGDILIIPESFF
ncbi:XrtA/PEP-CTERM system exopolysaccharide export protein [Thiohalomonas denitrificans]|uniref:Polysaccharide export outer membrane protein n=1 Tax=Thiohalomonas denitrificans TaxID=415747 RepID=A0A1G5Q2I4_9GAMM|nr:XrtA/PEP-CTERM system exopolysaccharide export protein [Thiohalomonas denitrificans]SCZ55872.1 polysaccharide export outer membrane protein [Thiohalomonas denitrificans]